MATILRGLGQPLLQVGDVVFDAEVSVDRGGEREMSERRLASGTTVADHSRRVPRVYEIEGAASALTQPQNVGRPGVSAAEFAPLPPAPPGVIYPGITSRLDDLEERLDAMLDDANFREVELVSKVAGRVRVVLLRWRASTTADDGRSARFRLGLREVQRFGVTIADGTAAALALNGSGGAPLPGGGAPSQATPGTLDVVP